MDDDEHDLGWDDPVGLLVTMEFALKTLVRGKGKYHERMEEVRKAFVWIGLERFPTRLRNRAASVLGTPDKVRVDVVSDEAGVDLDPLSIFMFQRLSAKQRDAYAEDLICLYSACLMDITKMTGDDHYPSDR
jgi:hypothetical protein